MKSKNSNKKDQLIKMKDQMGDTNHPRKKTKTKVKYNHKNHWLEQDEDYDFPKYREEEE